MTETAAPPRSALRYARILVALVLSVWLAWQVGAAGLAGLAARSRNPKLLAVMGTPTHPDAGALLAETLLASGDKAGATRVARATLLSAPIGDRAMRVLGLATEALGDRAAGARIMGQAASLGWRDTPTQLWVLHNAIMHDDAVTVIQRADALARRQRSTDMTRVIFLAAVNEPHLRAALIDSMGRHPVWRTSFFSDVRQRLPASSIPGMEAFFSEMDARHYAIRPDEWLNYVDRLIDLHDYRRARAIWARVFAIPAARLSETPYDGDFAQVAARADGAPVSQFEWTIDPNLAGLIDFAPGPGGPMLSIPADATSGTVVITQLVMLAPGSHTLSVRVSGNPNAAAWSMSCLPSGDNVPRRLPQRNALSTVALDIPTQGCDAQRLTLIVGERLDAEPISIAAVRIR